MHITQVIGYISNLFAILCAELSGAKVQANFKCFMTDHATFDTQLEHVSASHVYT